jgi:aminoglycoside phosphotransferase (APT) family kinase protein
MLSIDKNRPPSEWIEELRHRFPCETEIDRVLTSKQKRRAGPGYSPVSLETLSNGVKALLEKELKEPFEVIEPKWLSGGASKVQMAFKLRWNEPGVGRTTTRMVLRMEPAESAVETSRRREFQLIKAFEGILPVPKAYWADAEGNYFPYPAIIYGFADGVTKPTGSVSNVSGTGVNFGPELRPIIGAQYVEHMARMHTMDWRQADLSAFDVPALGTQAVEWQINWWERVWEEDSNQDIPLLRFAADWLRQNMPPVDRLSVIHGDFRAGNFLYTEHDNRISAWLDWELGHLGDRHEDLGYALNLVHAHNSEDGKTLLYNGFMPKEALFEAYEKASGLSVNPKVVDYYRVLSTYKLAVVCIGTTYRAVRGGKSHQDVLLAWLIGAGYVIADDLRRVLKEVA